MYIWVFNHWACLQDYSFFLQPACYTLNPMRIFIFQNIYHCFYFDSKLCIALWYFSRLLGILGYCKVASSRLSQLVAHFRHRERRQRRKLTPSIRTASFSKESAIWSILIPEQPNLTQNDGRELCMPWKQRNSSFWFT